MFTLGWIVAVAMVSSTSMETLDARVAAMLPTADEQRFLAIPWHTDLLRARREANAQGKPLFLWIMNGSPLGCT